MEVFKDFKVVGVDRDHIEKDITMVNAFKYPFLLSGKPDDLWVKFLHHAYRMSSFGKKRQYSVVGSTVIFVVFHDDQMQQQLDFLKELVATANEEYKKLIERKEEERREEEARKQRERDSIQRMKDETNRLSF